MIVSDPLLQLMALSSLTEMAVKTKSSPSHEIWSFSCRTLFYCTGTASVSNHPYPWPKDYSNPLVDYQLYLVALCLIFLFVTKGMNNIFTETVIGNKLTLKVLVTTIDAQWEGMGDVASARYEPTLLPPCPTIRVLSYSN